MVDSLQEYVEIAPRKRLSACICFPKSIKYHSYPRSEKVNKVYNENVTYTRKLYETHKKQGFPVSLRNKMKEIEGEINGIEPMGSF